MELLLLALVLVFGVAALGQVGRQRLLDAARPAATAETERPPNPASTSLLAPQIDWTAHDPLRHRRRATRDQPGTG